MPRGQASLGEPGRKPSAESQVEPCCEGEWWLLVAEPRNPRLEGDGASALAPPPLPPSAWSELFLCRLCPSPWHAHRQG